MESPLCPKCKKPMRHDDSEVCAELGWDPWVCDPCDDKAIARANERAEWNYYHSD